MPSSRSPVAASPPSWDETIRTTPAKPIATPAAAARDTRSPRTSRPSSRVKNGVVFTSTAAFAAPASVTPSAIPRTRG
jgi:hypothetical protein